MLKQSYRSKKKANLASTNINYCLSSHTIRNRTNNRRKNFHLLKKNKTLPI